MSTSPPPIRDLGGAPGFSFRLQDRGGLGRKALIQARNAQHSVWGFKRPEAYKQLARLCSLCRNPRVIVTFRDVLAISLRNNIAMQLDPIKMLPNLVSQYEVLVSTIRRLPVP